MMVVWIRTGNKMAEKSFLNLWDLTKSICLLAVVGFIWFHGKSIAEGYFAAIKPPPPPTVERIDENAIKLAAITASRQAAEEIRKQFEEEKSVILAAYEEQRKKTKEAMTALGKIQAELKQTRDIANRNSDHIYKPKPTGDPVKDAERAKNEQYYREIKIKNDKGVEIPLAWAMFYPNKPDGEQWKSGTFPLKFDTKIIESENPNGTTNFYAETTMESKGKTTALKLRNVQYAKYPQKTKSFHLWNPRLGFGGTFTNNGVSANLNLSAMSYGRTTRDLDWRFLTVGIGAAKYTENNDEKWKGVGVFEPLSWNLGNALPVVDNLFIGPTLTFDTLNEGWVWSTDIYTFLGGNDVKSKSPRLFCSPMVDYGIRCRDR
jgi:hypothetical protein